MASPETVVFANRMDAGRQLAARLEPLRGEAPVVLGLPRGGVVVAAEVARALDAPLDVIVVRKIGAPGRPELGLGAVTDGNEPVALLNEDLVQALRVPHDHLAREVTTQLAEVRRRQDVLRGGRPPVDLRDRTAILVDDGIATGGTVRAAMRMVRKAGPRRLVLAVPVAPADTIAALADEADAVMCLAAPEEFVAVGRFYADFRQTTEEEVIELLAERVRE
jgi:putative phosphoribosyl transferase